MDTLGESGTNTHNEYAPQTKTILEDPPIMSSGAKHHRCQLVLLRMLGTTS